MGVGATIFTTFGGLCTVMGIITAIAVKIPALAVVPEYVGLTWTFWLVLAAILFLVTIAFAVSRGGQSSSYE